MKKYFLITFLVLFSCTFFAPKKIYISLESAYNIQRANQMYDDYNTQINEDRDKDPKDKLDDRRYLDSLYLIKVSSIISTERNDIMNSRVSAKEKLTSIEKLIESFEKINQLQDKNNILVENEKDLTRVELTKLNLLSDWDERRNSLHKAINEYIKKETQILFGSDNNLNTPEIIISDSRITKNEEKIKTATYTVFLHATYNGVLKFNKELIGESTWIVTCTYDGSPITTVKIEEDKYTNGLIK